MNSWVPNPPQISGFQERANTLGQDPGICSRTTGLTSALVSHRTGWTARPSIHTSEEAQETIHHCSLGGLEPGPDPLVELGLILCLTLDFHH